MSLKAYKQDWAYKKHWATMYNKEQAQKIIKKLTRHFKVNIKHIDFSTNKTGFAFYTGIITLPKKDIPLGMLCHEVGHLLAFSKGYKGHTKKTYKYIHRIYKYAIKYIPVNILLDLDKLLLEKF